VGFHQRAEVEVLHGALGLPEAGEIDAIGHRLVLQVAFAALVADRAVERVVDQQELHHPFAGLLDHGRVGLDHRRLALGPGAQVAHLHRAGGGGFRRAAHDLDKAHPAVAGDGQAFVVAEARDLDAGLSQAWIRVIAGSTSISLPSMTILRRSLMGCGPSGWPAGAGSGSQSARRFTRLTRLLPLPEQPANLCSRGNFVAPHPAGAVDILQRGDTALREILPRDGDHALLFGVVLDIFGDLRAGVAQRHGVVRQPQKEGPAAMVRRSIVGQVSSICRPMAIISNPLCTRSSLRSVSHSSARADPALVASVTTSSSTQPQRWQSRFSWFRSFRLAVFRHLPRGDLGRRGVVIQ
jgi:hypothetical protein